jgi:glucose-6-phosphate 1-dehydrogenase
MCAAIFRIRKRINNSKTKSSWWRRNTAHKATTSIISRWRRDFSARSSAKLGSAGLAEERDGHWRRVVIEKPFGRDLESARALNAEIKQVLDERQIYRIDHYLGKETVQNIMMFRFGNGIFEPIWNRRYIDHVQISAAETVGVELRGGYYETAGALRDMVPNHLFQLVSLTAMEPPISFHADAVRDEQAKVLHRDPTANT